MQLSSGHMIENFFNLLWKKDQQAHKQQLKILIPDTIIFRNNSVQNWYFTSQKGQIFLKKNKNLDQSVIFDFFVNQSSGKSDIVGYLICFKDEGIKLLPNDPSVDKNKLIIRYLNPKGLAEFLFDGSYQHPENSILQQFIQPYGQYNQCIEAIWSPSMSMFTKRVNLRKLYNKEYDIYEKAVTFDGGEAYSKTVPIQGEKLNNDIKQIIEEMVQHIALVTKPKINISRMVLYFKCDQNDNIYFMYCSSIRILQQNVKKPFQFKRELHNAPLNIDTNYEKPPEIKRVITVNTMRPQKFHNDIQCLDCNQLIQQEDLYPIKYKILVQYFDSQKDESATKKNPIVGGSQNQHAHVVEIDENYLVPAIFHQIYPDMTAISYFKIQRDTHFENLTIILCNECFLQYTDSQVQAGSEAKVEPFLQFKPAMKITKSPFTNELQQKFLKDKFRSTEWVSPNNIQSYSQSRSSMFTPGEKNTLNSERQNLMSPSSYKHSLQTSLYSRINFSPKIITPMAKSHQNFLIQRPVTTVENKRDYQNIFQQDSIFNNMDEVMQSPKTSMGFRNDTNQLTEIKAIYNNFQFPKFKDQSISKYQTNQRLSGMQQGRKSINIQNKSSSNPNFSQQFTQFLFTEETPTQENFPIRKQTETNV